MTTETLTAAEIAALEQFRCDRRWSYRQLAADVSEVCGVPMPESSLTRAMTVPLARLRKTTIHPLRKYLTSSTRQSAVRYDGRLMAEDTAAKGWLQKDLAKRARLSSMTVGRFFTGEFQTPRTAKKLARALGRDVERYLIRSTEVVAS